MTLLIDGLAVGYRRTTVLAGLHAVARSGELTVLMGPNGTGKSTLLRTIAGLQPPLAGTVRYDGCADSAPSALPLRATPTRTSVDLLALTPAERARVLAVVLTERVDAGLLTARELVALGRLPHLGPFGALAEVDVAAVAAALQATGAAALADRRVAELSDGERQRVLTARALAQAPRVLLLDEPGAFLDVSARVALLDLLRTLAREQRMCVVVSTHDLELALRLADCVWLVDGERGLRTGTPEELAADGAIGRAFDTAALAFDPASGTFTGTGPPGPTVRVRGTSPELVARALRRHGWTPVDDGPADAEVTARQGTFRAQTGGHTVELPGWDELGEWARTTVPGPPRRAGSIEVAAALRAAGSVGAFFAVEDVPDDPAGWTRLDPAGLAALTDSVAERLGTDERRVAASIMLQGVAARLVSPVLAGLGRGLLLDLDPATALVQPRPGEALGVACAYPGAWLTDRPDGPDTELAADVVVEQLRPLVDAVAADGPVAARLLWGNVASALVGALRVLGSPDVAVAAVRTLLDHGPLAGSGELRPEGFRRTSCCLFYRTPTGGYCGDCALVPAR